jgi:hypothetical protein
LVDDALSKARKLPPARNSYRVDPNIGVPTRDGARLVTDHYAPTTAGRGTVLIRSPYGRGLPVNVLHGRTLAARGYHVIIQSVRGTAGSSGPFRPMAQETDDGQDTVAWLRDQPWFDGRLATLGGSYLGWTQWALMQDPPPELSTAVVIVGPHDFRRATYGTGAFALNDFLGWTATASAANPVLGALKARKAKAAVDGLPLADAADEALGGSAPWFREWLTHPDIDDPFWDPYNAGSALHKVQIPVLLFGGWQDLFLDQTVEQYRVLNERGVDVALTIGPWVHTDTMMKAAGVIDRQTLSWLDEHLAGEPAEPSAPVRIFLNGAEEWRELPVWPPSVGQTGYWLAAGNQLTGTPDTSTSSISFRYDPADPTPSIGGRMMSGGAGVQDNTRLEARNDVVTFTSTPVATDIDVIGAPVAEIHLGTDNPHADLFVRLCDVDEKGRSHNVTDALQRLDPERQEPHTVRLELSPCAHRVLSGHRLRLQISGGAHPRYARNSGTDAVPGTGSELVSTRHTVYFAGSSLTLPMS